jgi:DNA-binding ferritin-like protein (Dps family)
VEHKFGKYIVGDDYEIICWDFVSDPSTNNAWVDKDKEKLQKLYDEGYNDALERIEEIKAFINNN